MNPGQPKNAFSRAIEPLMDAAEAQRIAAMRRMYNARDAVMDAAEAQRIAVMRGMYNARDAIGAAVTNPYIAVPAALGAAGLVGGAMYMNRDEPDPIAEREQALQLLDAHLSPSQQQQLQDFIEQKQMRQQYINNEAQTKAQMLQDAADYKEKMLREQAARQLNSLDMMQI